MCWKSVINIAAVSRSTIPSLPASTCSSADGSTVTDDLDERAGPAGAVAEAAAVEAALLLLLLLLLAALLPPRRRLSATSGIPPSFACTVRSWRRRRSRRTKVLRHFRHLKGRSFVSAEEVSNHQPQQRIGASRTGSLVSAAMFASAEGTVAELALVLSLRGVRRLLPRSRGIRRSRGSHLDEQVSTAIAGPGRRAEEKKGVLTGTGIVEKSRAGTRSFLEDRTVTESKKGTGGGRRGGGERSKRGGTGPATAQESDGRTDRQKGEAVGRPIGVVNETSEAKKRHPDVE